MSQFAFRTKKSSLPSAPTALLLILNRAHLTIWKICYKCNLSRCSTHSGASVEQTSHCHGRQDQSWRHGHQRRFHLRHRWQEYSARRRHDGMSQMQGHFPHHLWTDLVDGSGNGYARHMDSTACGAKLISGQITTTWSSESSMGDPAADDKADSLAAASLIASPTTSGICLDCMLKAAATGSATVVRE